MNELSAFVLDLATEDYYGLWELWNTLRARRTPSDPVRLREALDAIVRSMLADGLIELAVGSTFDGEESRLDNDQASAAIGDPRNWVMPDAPSRIKLVATPSGQRAYRNGSPR